MSTHIRLAFAAAALGLIAPVAAPAAASADTGGAQYGTSTSSSTQRPARSTRSHGSRSHRGPRARYSHLGDRVPVRRGMRGHDVKILQDFMNRLGMKIAIDGSFGHATWAALRRFEKRAGLPVDGVLDQADLDALRQVIGAGGWGSKLRQQQQQDPPPLAPGSRAKVNSDGTATAPADAPAVVQQIIASGNEIATKPYVYGGGHGRWNDRGYDCSGSVSYALHGAGLLDQSMDSSQLESYGDSGPGQWVTIYANAGHAYMVVAGLRFDTSGRSQAGTRWQADMRSSSGYVVRHPTGL